MVEEQVALGGSFSTPGPLETIAPESDTVPEETAVYGVDPVEWGAFPERGSAGNRTPVVGGADVETAGQPADQPASQLAPPSVDRSAYQGNSSSGADWSAAEPLLMERCVWKWMCMCIAWSTCGETCR